MKHLKGGSPWSDILHYSSWYIFQKSVYGQGHPWCVTLTEDCAVNFIFKTWPKKGAIIPPVKKMLSLVHFEDGIEMPQIKGIAWVRFKY